MDTYVLALAGPHGRRMNLATFTGRHKVDAAVEKCGPALAALQNPLTDAEVVRHKINTCLGESALTAYDASDWHWHYDDRRHPFGLVVEVYRSGEYDETFRVAPFLEYDPDAPPPAPVTTPRVQW